MKHLDRSVRKKDRTEYKKVMKLQQIRLDVNFDKSTITFYFLRISLLLVKFPEDQRSITMLSIKYLNFKFLYMHKNKFIDQMVNNIQLT